MQDHGDFMGYHGHFVGYHGDIICFITANILQIAVEYMEDMTRYSYVVMYYNIYMDVSENVVYP